MVLLALGQELLIDGLIPSRVDETMPKAAAASYGWYIQEINIYTSPTSNKPLPRIVPSSPLITETVTTGIRNSDIAGFVQMRYTITTGDGNTLRAIGITYQLTSDDFVGSGAHGRESFLFYERLPDIVKVADEDIDLLVNLHLRRI